MTQAQRRVAAPADSQPPGQHDRYQSGLQGVEETLAKFDLALPERRLTLRFGGPENRRPAMSSFVKLLTRRSEYSKLIVDRKSLFIWLLSRTASQRLPPPVEGSRPMFSRANHQLICLNFASAGLAGAAVRPASMAWKRSPL